MSHAIPARRARRVRRAVALSAAGLAGLTSVAGAASREFLPRAAIKLVDEHVDITGPCVTLPPLNVGEPPRRICPPTQYGTHISGVGFLPGENVRVTTEIGGDTIGTGKTTSASIGTLQCVVQSARPPCIMGFRGGGVFGTTGGRDVFAWSLFYSHQQVTIRAVGQTSGRVAIRHLPIVYLE